MIVQFVPSVSVDAAACARLASVLAGAAIPPDEEEQAAPGLPPARIGNFFLALVAICHQTSPRGRAPLEGVVDGIKRRGWDYLFARFASAVDADRRWITAEGLSRVSTGDVRSIFFDQTVGERLTSPERRAALLRDLGERMIARRWQTADDLYRECGGRVAAGERNLLTELSGFRAYDDPVRKKSLFFLSLMRNAGRWSYRDENALGPPVDYHEVRGHLRLGTVVVESEELLGKLRSGQEVTADEDAALRGAVYRAIMRVAELCPQYTPSRLHYLFWNVFRSICTRTHPQCFALHPDCTLPPRYRPVACDEGDCRCPFARICRSAGQSDPVCEHVFETDYY